MIGFMPDFYPDELVYSLLARYYQRSGYLAYIHAARDLYTVPTIRPDMYFINPRSPLYIKDENEKYIYMILPINLS